MEDKDFVYTNIFDAMVDTYFLTEAIRYAGVLIMITQSVQPSYGINEKALIPTIENARTYNDILLKEGTPKRARMSMEMYIFFSFQGEQNTRV